MEAMVSAPKNKLTVYSIVEREGFDRAFWAKIGMAFKNRDGSYNIRLDALPCNGKLHMREESPDKKHDKPLGAEVTAPIRELVEVR